MNDDVITLNEIGKIGTVKVYNQAYVDKLELKIKTLEEENAALKRDKEGLIFVRDQKAKCMCEDKERLAQAKEILRKYHEECPKKYSLEDIDNMAEQFLKETKDIREDSTLDGDWVVDKH